MPRKILIAGEGGQGIQTIAKILAKAAKESGKKLSYIPSFGVEQRGGVSLSFVQIGEEKASYPRFYKADILVIFCNRAVSVISKYINENTLVIYDSSAIEEETLSKIKDKIKNYVAIPAQQIAQDKYSTKVLNMILLGALISHLKEIEYIQIENQMKEELKSKIEKDPSVKDLNLSALNEGINFSESFNKDLNPLEGTEKKQISQEFSSNNKKWIRFPEYCKGCSLCIVKCPVKALQFSRDLGFLGNPVPIVDIDKCIGCGACMQICPDGAIKVEKN
jgi:2-oxoglutarate ferredoxin oxidoreductase subunit gamma